MRDYSEILILRCDEDPPLLEDAAIIFYLAFRQKVHNIELFPKSKSQAIRILTASFVPGQILLAKVQGTLVGVLGIDDDRGRFIRFAYSDLTGEFGFIGGIARFLWLKFIGWIEKQAPGTLRIAAIAVAEEARGSGVGTRLLEAAEEFAHAQGYKALVLEVVDTNPRARKLYERMGFKIIKTDCFGFITRPAGFTASISMRKDLK
jgi:ribosomal protein S18 acetylase RimI-like enzyme